MNFRKRLKFYGIGLSLGILVIAIMFGPRAFTCTYFPNARTLDEAKFVPIQFSEKAQLFANSQNIDSVFIYDELFKKSEITNFGTDEVRQKPCRVYRAEYKSSPNSSYKFIFKLCKEKTIVEEIDFLNK